MNSPWLLLIYSVPAEPTRTRASVWREVNKIGAVDLLLEDCDQALAAFLERAAESDASRP